jgi:uncharacterized protein YbbC (DUF1343 family)
VTLSEGRGPDRPFEQIGAPWLRAEEVAKVMNARCPPEVEIEAVTMSVLPTAAKHRGSTIPAIRFRVTDREAYRPVRSSLLLSDEIRRRHLADFKWTATIGGYVPREQQSIPALLTVDGQAKAYPYGRRPPPTALDSPC